jgi:hypothetical protein
MNTINRVASAVIAVATVVTLASATLSVTGVTTTTISAGTGSRAEAAPVLAIPVVAAPAPCGPSGCIVTPPPTTTATTRTTPTPTPTYGSDTTDAAFLYVVSDLSWFSGVPDKDLIDLGKAACGVFAPTSLSEARTLLAYLVETMTDEGVPTYDAATFIGASIASYCPEYFHYIDEM